MILTHLVMFKFFAGASADESAPVVADFIIRARRQLRR